MNQKRKGIEYEKRSAKKYGGRLTPSSGAFDFAKGDIHQKYFVIDTKYTEKESFSLKASQIRKLKQEAKQHSKDWAFLIQILDQEVLVMSPDFLKVLEEYYDSE